MKIKINLNKYLIFLSLIIAWSTWICFMIPLPVASDDITNILVLIFFVFVIFFGNLLRKMPVNKQFLFFIGIVVTASIAAYVLFRQSIVSSLIAMRHMYLQYTIAIPLYYLIKSEKITREQLYNTVIVSSRITTTIYVLFYLLHSYVHIDILNVVAGYQRYGSDRFYLSLVMPIFLMCNAFSNLYSEKMKIINYYDILAVLYLILYVTKMRFSAFSCACAIMIGLMVAKELDIKKILLIVGAMCAALALLLFTEMGQDFLNLLTGGENETSGIRDIGRVKHLLSFLKSPVFGLGYPHESCYAAMYEFGSLNTYIINGTETAICYTDNGIFDFLYTFGLIGVAWIIAYFGHWLKKSVRLIKKRNLSVYFMYILATIIDMYTECTWLFFGTLFIGILDTLIRTEPEEEELPLQTID